MNAEEKDLLNRHLNGDLEGAEQAAFLARLQASPELRRELASQSFDEVLLSEIVLEKRVVASPRRRSWLPVSIAAAMLIGLTVMLTRGREEASPIRVASAEGSALLQRGDAQEPLRIGLELRWGDRIVTAQGSAVVDHGGVRLQLERDSSLVFRHPKSGYALERGALRATTQGGPLLLTSRHGEAETYRRGSLRFEVFERQTQVDVDEGTVQVHANVGSMSSAVWVSAGQRARLGTDVQIGRIVPRAKVDDAVRRAGAFLESRKSDLVLTMVSEKRNAPPPHRTYAELALLALHRAGRPDSDPLKQELLGLVKGRSIESTYSAGLQSMALAEIDPVAHHGRIRLCAQLLVDSQCANGQWDYAVKTLPDVPATGRIRRRQDGPAGGDNSVSSYAVLGLLAAARAGVDLDPDVLERARGWWLKCQNADGGWGYNDFNVPGLGDAAKTNATTNASYGSMTASAVAALAAIRELRGGEGLAAIRRGLEWLGANFAVDRNPRKDPGLLPVHWLLSAERAGLELGTERFGVHEWYPEGADFLLSAQRPTGEWVVEHSEFMGRERNDILDTCLAILFLRRDGR